MIKCVLNFVLISRRRKIDDKFVVFNENYDSRAYGFIYLLFFGI